MKQRVLLFIVLGAAVAVAEQKDQKQDPKIRHIIGLDSVKRNANGHIKIQNGVMQFTTDQSDAKVPITQINDIFIGNETTQSGGTAGKVVKTAAMAAPFGSGKALTLLMRTKVDMLTVVYQSAGGDLHAAIFALPKGLADPMRAQLVAAGAHASAPQTELKERTNQ